jgi:hypothetical protein
MPTLQLKENGAVGYMFSATWVKVKSAFRHAKGTKNREIVRFFGQRS